MLASAPAFLLSFLLLARNAQNTPVIVSHSLARMTRKANRNAVEHCSDRYSCIASCSCQASPLTDPMLKPHLQAVPLAAVVLECLTCDHQGAVEAAVEFFDLMNAVPVEQRHPQLGPPVYATALPHLTRQARYPLPFSTWEECELDSDSFHSFR